MSKSKEQAEQQEQTLEQLQRWVEQARTLTGNINPRVVFKYAGHYTHEDIPTTFNKVVDVEYSLVNSTLTFLLSE